MRIAGRLDPHLRRPDPFACRLDVGLRHGRVHDLGARLREARAAENRPGAVLEGRVQNVRTRGRHNSEYVADIAGRTVKVTTPVYDRLKFLPVVRVEVGRGSNYVYAIEYLAN